MQIITNYSSQIDSVMKLQEIIRMITNGTENLSQLDLLCTANPMAIDAILEQFTNMSLNSAINLGMPICSDNNILDDLIRWSVEYVAEIAAAKQHSDVCK